MFDVSIWNFSTFPLNAIYYYDSASKSSPVKTKVKEWSNQAAFLFAPFTEWTSY